VHYLDASAVRSPDGKTVTFFLINRHPDEALTIDVDMAGFAPQSLVQHVTIVHADLNATNTARHPDRVRPVKGRGVSVKDGAVRGKLPPRSWQMLQVAI
jgi:alpha-N-arabinofuranosidase